MRLFVDDERPVPDDTWTLAERSHHALAIMRQIRLDGDRLTALSLDHDLSTTFLHDDTSRPVMLYMCENNWWPDRLWIHTANPCGEEWLVGMTERYAPAGTLVAYGPNYWRTSAY